MVITETLQQLRTDGDQIVTADGTSIRLRGVCVGGWLSMENFLTGYAGNEALMRSTVASAIGPEKAARFFSRLQDAFFDEADAAFLASSGFNSVRIPLNYRLFEDDAEPFRIREEGFRLLDRAIEQCGRHGIYTVIDLHALPGAQNHDWHSDNDAHAPAFWRHPHFQDRVVNLWEVIAARYRGDARVAGYNLMNEPADESRSVIGPFYERLFKAVRAVDLDHTIFLDGNTYGTEFDFFAEPWENTVYTLHDYVPAGFGRGGPYPGVTDGAWVDRESAERKFLERSAYARATGTPLVVGEFGPTYTGDPVKDAQRRQILTDQLDLYRRNNVSWAVWVYKDLGRQGVVSVRPDSPYLRRFGAFVERKNRLGADHWGSTELGVREVTEPVQKLVADEFPTFDPYPWGRFDWVRRLMLNIMIARPLAEEYADLLRGLDDRELDALADSFAFEQCEVQTTLLALLQNG